MRAMQQAVRPSVMFVLGIAFGVGADPAPRSKTKEVPDGWLAWAPRDEIRPDFAYEPTGGPDGKGCLTIKADRRDGLDGYWARSFPITGGQYYRFEARYRAEGVSIPRRNIVA